MRVEEQDEPLERLYARLTRALQSQRSNPWTAPVTVAEIYQELIPYRVVREDAGFAMNADYEHALLRLLSGEGDWARLEPPTARDAIERELSSSNPNVTIYREYAACDVWIKAPRNGLPAAATAGPPAQAEDNGLEELETRSTFALDVEPAAATASAPQPAPARQPEPSPQPAPAQSPPPPPSASASAPAPAPKPQSASAPPSVAPSAPAPPDRGQAAAVSGEGPGSHCAFCDSRLPSRRKVRFCPFCGGDQSMVPCGTCGEALESAWLFCVACGTSAPIP
jgi:hypothetical protein